MHLMKTTKKESIEYLNVKNKYENTALMKATSNNHTECVKELINAFDENYRKELIK